MVWMEEAHSGNKGEGVDLILLSIITINTFSIGIISRMEPETNTSIELSFIFITQLYYMKKINRVLLVKHGFD